MRPISLAAGGGWGNLPWRSWNKRGNKLRSQSSGSDSAGAGSTANKSYLERVKGWNGPLKAALTSASLSATGDLLAQGLSYNHAKSSGLPFQYDPSRTLRMFGYGFVWYGPCQFYWYNLLEFLMPIKNTTNFLIKVAANQLMLGPVTLSTVFAWNLALTNQASKIPEKIQNDLFPTIQNGWKFWVPAASVNFYCIPLQYQVLYMSACGVLWTAYLSYASSTQIKAPPKKSCCGGKKLAGGTPAGAA